MDIGIRLKGVGLEVPHFVQQERSVRSWAATLFAAATSRFKRDYRVLLKDVSFEIHDGERVALLGRNGAGKTTLLRLLAGTLQPTQGMLEVKGSRQALLNLGLGFNAEATVRENIFLRGTAMGLRPSMIRDQVSAILDFAGLEHVANHRLATLSSGQRMRLGFAVSTSVQHDIMLLDEWFGAGDAEFVHKARARMSGRVAGSRIVILASHNFKMLKEVCSRGIVIDQGGVAFDGPLAGAIEAYKMVFATTPEQREANQAELEGRIRNRERKEKLSELRETLQEERRKLRAERKRMRELRRKIEASKAGMAQRELQAPTQDAAGQEIDGSEPSR